LDSGQAAIVKKNYGLVGSPAKFH